MSRRLIQIASGTLAGLAAVAAAMLFGWLPGGPGAEPDPHVLSTPFPAPELRLTDHTGAPFDLASVEGTAVVFFGFTHCPDVCPVTLARLARALDEMGGRAGAVQVVFVTVDPARDTPDRVARYVEGFHPDFVGLTGTEEEVADAAAAWGIYRSLPDTADRDDGYSVDHTARSFVVDADGRVWASFGTEVDAEAMRRTLEHVVRGP